MCDARGSWKVDNENKCGDMSKQSFALSVVNLDLKLINIETRGREDESLSSSFDVKFNSQETINSVNTASTAKKGKKAFRCFFRRCFLSFRIVHTPQKNIKCIVCCLHQTQQSL